jgi:hypothetical protein
VQWGGIHCSATDETFCFGSNSGRLLSRLKNYFILMFPSDQLAAMIELTNMKLMAKGKKVLTKGEFLKFISVAMSCTHFEFWEKDLALVHHTGWSKNQPAACFGKSGMVWKRFDEIWGNLTFSHQLEQRPDDASSKTYYW